MLFLPLYVSYERKIILEVTDDFWDSNAHELDTRKILTKYVVIVHI